MNKRGLLPVSALVIIALAVIVVVGSVIYLAAQPPVPAGQQAAQPTSTQFQAVDISNRQTYRNEKYGFEVKLPDSWRGFKTFKTSSVIYDMSVNRSNAIAGHFEQIEIIHPSSTVAQSRQNIPIMIFTLEQWKHVGGEQPDWNVSAAPIPPSELARNSQYVFALPARYNYAFLPGWEEVQKIIDEKSVTAFEPVLGTSASSTSLTAGWKTYRNEKYGFEFRYPKTVPVNPDSYWGGPYVDIGISNPADFEGFLNDGAFDDKLKYDSAKNQWIVQLGINETAGDALCPYELKSKQGIPYYHIGDFRSGREWVYVFVTKKGIIELSESDDQLIIANLDAVRPGDIIFDNPQDVLFVTCGER